jgi:hypothetical protein
LPNPPSRCDQRTLSGGLRRDPVPSRHAGYSRSVLPAAGYTPPDDTPKINVGDHSFRGLHVPGHADRRGRRQERNTQELVQSHSGLYQRDRESLPLVLLPHHSGHQGGERRRKLLTGNQTFRIKYGYGQVNFDDFAPRGSWFRFGLQQTPYVDFAEGIYRYRFQGAIFSDTEGF